MPLVISANILAKLAAKVPPVSVEEIEQCFATRDGIYLIDQREEHASDPPTRWFLAPTYFGRILKIVFIPRGKDIVIRTAYDPNAQERQIYTDFGMS